jgi:hypothetical protein
MAALASGYRAAFLGGAVLAAAGLAGTPVIYFRTEPRGAPG